MVNTQEKAPIETQKLKRNKHKHTIKENHQAIKEEQKEEMNKEEHKQLENKV